MREATMDAMQLRSPISRRPAIGPAAVSLLCAVGLSACSASSAAVAIDRYSPGHQQPVGTVAGATLSGGHVSLSGLRGHVVVVNFWSSTCAPCRAEQTTLNEVQRATAKQGVRFVGVDERDDASEAKAFLALHPATYPSLFDPNGAMTLQFPDAEPETTPTTIVVSPAGMIAARVNGSILFSQLLALIRSVERQAA